VRILKFKRARKITFGLTSAIDEAGIMLDIEDPPVYGSDLWRFLVV
jgi:hypothetical protein